MNYDKHIRRLMVKFSQDECTLEEKRELLQYFKDKPNIEVMPELNEKQRDENELLPENANVIYDKILERIQPLRKTNGKVKAKKSKFYLVASIAAVFIAVLGVSYYFQIATSRDIAQPVESAIVASNDVIVLDLGNGKKEVLSESGSLEIADEEGHLLGGQQGNKLVYEKHDIANEEIVYNTLTIPNGKTFEIQLSDGSIVHLNSGSSLKYPVRFPKQGTRQVYLSGEAFFKVAKNEKQRFIVESGDLQIAVLGTEFNVSAYSEDIVQNVVLVQGAVNMGSKSDIDKNVILKPGQLGTLNPGSTNIEIQEVDTKIYTSWLDGALIFKNLTFKVLLQKMERHYNVKITNKNLSMADVKFNAHFKNEEIVEVLNYFNDVYGLSFEIVSDDEFIINP